jgi:hypothetical protein
LTRITFLMTSRGCAKWGRGNQLVDTIKWAPPCTFLQFIVSLHLCKA